MSQSKKFLLLILISLAFTLHCSDSEIDESDGNGDCGGVHTATTSMVSNPSSLEQLLAVNGIPADRMASWAINVHPVIAGVLGSENYSSDLRNLVSASSWLIEQRTQSVFESHLEENQGRVKDVLAPRLLENNGNLPEQAKILMWMVDMHPQK